MTKSNQKQCLIKSDKKYALGDISLLFFELDKPLSATFRRDISGLRDFGYLDVLPHVVVATLP